MIIKVLRGSKKGKQVKNLDEHLRKADENEKVEIRASSEDITSVKDIVNLDIRNKKEFKKKGRYNFIHLVVNPRWNLSETEWNYVWSEIEKEYGLEASDWIEFSHKKKGKVHKHRVYVWTNSLGENVDASYIVNRSLKLGKILTEQVETINFEQDNSWRLRWDRLSPKEYEILRKKGEDLEDYLRRKAQKSIEKGYTTDEYEVELTKKFISGELSLQEVRDMFKKHLVEKKERGTDEELEEIKNIDLVSLFEQEGFKEKLDKTSKTYRVFVDKYDDDKVYVVNTKTNRYFISEKSRGIERQTYSAIDFIQEFILNEYNLGSVRKWYRENYKGIKTAPSPRVIEERNRGSFRNVLKSLKKADYCEWLEQDRGITLDLEDYDIYIWQVKEHKNIAVKHYKAEGRKLKVCGLETRGRGKNDKKFKGNFGEKSIGIINPSEIKTADRIVVCESFIDCLSYAQLKRDYNSLLVSTAGIPSELAIETLIKIAKAKNMEVAIAFDNDNKGEMFARLLSEKLKEAGVEHYRERPRYKDWNDDVRWGMDRGSGPGM